MPFMWNVAREPERLVVARFNALRPVGRQLSLCHQLGGDQLCVLRVRRERSGVAVRLRRMSSASCASELSEQVVVSRDRTDLI